MLSESCFSKSLFLSMCYIFKSSWKHVTSKKIFWHNQQHAHMLKIAFQIFKNISTVCSMTRPLHFAAMYIQQVMWFFPKATVITKLCHFSHKPKAVYGWHIHESRIVAKVLSGIWVKWNLYHVNMITRMEYNFLKFICVIHWKSNEILCYIPDYRQALCILMMSMLVEWQIIQKKIYVYNKTMSACVEWNSYKLHRLPPPTSFHSTTRAPFY